MSPGDDHGVPWDRAVASLDPRPRSPSMLARRLRSLAPMRPTSRLARAGSLAAALMLALSPITTARAGDPGGTAAQVQSAAVVAARSSVRATDPPTTQTEAQDRGTAGTVHEQLAVGLGGSHDVTPTGGFTYRIPIELPRWAGGVAPDLAITYDSQARAGALGVGATLTGLPTIVRTVDEHGLSYGTSADRFAVSWAGGGTPASPGGLLVEDPGAPGRYRTSEDTWTQFAPIGTCGAGPCAWRGTRPDGSVLVFGGKPDATIVERAGGGHGARGIRTWALSHVRDLHGNSFTVSYDEDEAMLYPRRIDEACDLSWGSATPWTVPGISIPGDTPDGGTPPPTLPTLPGDFTLGPNTVALAFDPWIPLPTVGGGGIVLPGASGVTVTEPTATSTCAQLRSVDFRYRTSAARPDPTPLPDRNARLLEYVDVNGASGRLHRYQFNYQTSPVTGASRLTTVTRSGVAVGATPAPALPPTTLGWSTLGTWRSQSGLAPFTTQASWPVVPSGGTVDSLVGDVDGDGRDDVVRVTISKDAIDARFALATGGAEAFAAVSARVALPSGQTSESGDWGDWRAVLADLDVDGRKDLVLVLAHRDRARVLIAAGSDAGLRSFVDYGHHVALDHFVDPRVLSYWHRVLVGDVNGDQADDLLILDTTRHDVLMIAGATGGAAAPIERSTASASAPGFWHSEPRLVDLDGDGLLDLVMIENRSRDGVAAAGARLFAFLGSRQQGLRPPDEINLASDREIGTSPYQALIGDVDADGVSDIIASYTGFTNSTTAAARRPLGRDLRVVYGDWQYQRDDVVSASWPAVVADPTDQIDLDLTRDERSSWIHLSGDVDGDGCADVLAHYAGARGERLDVYRADCRGGFRPVERHTLAAARPDGGANRHRVRARVVDLDDDGFDDLIRYYAGDQGQWIEVAFGAASGLAPTTLGRFRRLLTENAATGSVAEVTSADDGGRAGAVDLLLGDWNGDGRRDLALVHAGRALTSGAAVRVAVAPTASTSNQPDQVTLVSNGFGATVAVEYAAPVAAGAIDRAAVCALPVAADCGLPATWSRPLATRVTLRDGRPGTPVRSLRYRYHDGRYYPGYGVAVDPPLTARTLRADLAFARVVATDEQLATTTTTTYRQDRPFHRQVATVEVAAPLAHGAGSWPDVLPRRRTSYRYESVATVTRGSKALAGVVRPIEVRHDDQELGSPSRNLVRTLGYGPYGAVISDTECADGACIETVVSHQHDPARWIVNRETERVVRRAEPAIDLVMSWRRTDYDGDQISAVSELVCADSMKCSCEADAEACVGDGRGRWITVASGLTYDPRGNPTRVVDAAGHATSTVWDPTGTLPETVTRWIDHGGVAVPSATTTTNDDAGRPRERRASSWGPGVTAVAGWTGAAPSGIRTSWQYDGLGRPSRVDHPDGGWETWQYPNTGVATSQARRHERSLDAGRSAVETAYYDGAGRVYRTTTTGPLAGETVEVRAEEAIRADAGGIPLLRRRVSMPRFVPASGDPIALWTETTFDPLELPIRTARVRGTATTTAASWDLERIIRIGQRTSTQRARADQAADGSLVGTPVWLTEGREVDSRGRLRSIDGEHAVRAEYWYDDALRLERIVGPFVGAGPGSQYSGWSYDSLGRVIAEEDDRRGGRYYQYDDRGYPTERVDDLGRIVTWRHDALGRVIEEVSPDGTVAWSYDAPTVPRSLGRRTGVTGPWGSERITSFDAAGRVTGRERSIGSLPRQTLTSAFDHLGRRVVHTLPDGSALRSGYDLAGNLTTLDLGPTRYLTQAGFDANHRPRTRTTRASAIVLDHDALGLARGVTATSVVTNAEQLALSYQYASTGELTAVTDGRATTTVGAIDTDATASYGFDRLGRLTSSTDATGAVTPYAHDPAGNLVRRGALEFVAIPGRLLVQQAAVVTPCAVPPGQPIPPGCVSQPAVPMYRLHYNDVGNVEARVSTTGATWSYRYDSADRLVEAVDPDGLATSMAYDADGARVRRSEQVRDGTIDTYVIDPAYELRVRDDDVGNAVATIHVAAPGVGPLASITSTALSGTGSLLSAAVEAGMPLHGSPVTGYRKGTIHYLTDHLGSPRLVVNALTNELTRYSYEPWGDHAVSTSTGTDLTDVGFTGQRRDASTGLSYYGARYYDPLVGRFTTADSVLPDGGLSLRGLNRSAYAFGNPVTYVDPDGHEPRPFSEVPSGRPNERWSGGGDRAVDLTDGNGNEIFNPDVKSTNRQYIADLVRGRAAADRGTVDSSDGGGGTFKGILRSLGFDVGRNEEGENTISVDAGPLTVEASEKDGMPALAAELSAGIDREIGPVKVQAEVKASAKATVRPGADGYVGDTEVAVKGVLKVTVGPFAVEYEKSAAAKDRWRVRYVEDYFRRTVTETAP